MPSNRSFTAADIAGIMQHISGIRMMLPNSIKFKSHIRRSIFKLSSKRMKFVENALGFMKRHPETVPAYVDIRHCQNALELYNQYSDLLEEVTKLKVQLEDLKVHAGNELMNQTRAYFHNTRFAAESGMEKFEGIYKELKPHYAVGRNSKRA
jgi:hypothetical protein